MKKALSFLLLSAVLLALLAGCGQTALQLDASALAEELAESGAFSDLLSPIDLKIAANLYGVDASAIASGAMYCSTGATAEEVAVFKCTDENAAKTLEAAAHTRLGNQKAAYADYAPQSVPAIENAIVRQLGEYLICVVADKQATVESVLAKYIK